VANGILRELSQQLGHDHCSPINQARLAIAPESRPDHSNMIMASFKRRPDWDCPFAAQT